MTNAPDTLLENLNSYHPNIKFTVEENPNPFLDTFKQKMEISLQESIKKLENYSYLGILLYFQKGGNATLFQEPCTMQKK